MPCETSLRLPKRSVLCCMLLYIVTIAIFCNFTNERQHYWKRGFHKWRFLSCQIVAQTKKWEWKEFKPILTHTNLALKLILFFIIEKKICMNCPMMLAIFALHFFKEITNCDWRNTSKCISKAQPSVTA